LTPNNRSALAALDRARPAVARLDIAGHPEDIAAGIVEAWSAVETALRSLLGGSALGGQALVREVRQQELLKLEDAHALLEFLAARDRVERTAYRPTSADVAAARQGFQRLEGALGYAGAAGDDVLVPVAPAEQVSTTTVVTAPAGGRRRSMVIAAVVLAVVVIGALAVFAFMGMPGGEPRMIRDGQQLYAEGRRDAARRTFEDASRRYPDDATPHIYLGRIAREENDRATALRELERAIRLEPTNSVALREMGALQLTSGNLELARNFYRRAVESNPDDRLALGYLGCTLVRMGQRDLGASFLSRAGSGDWDRCAAAPAPAAR
jgi:tetratricopeptide (TPR) repeat protein